MSRPSMVVTAISRIIDAVVFPVYAIYAALLFQVFGPDDVAEVPAEYFSEGHTTALAESRTG